MLHADVVCEATLELGSPRAARQPARTERLRDRLDLLLPTAGGWNERKLVLRLLADARHLRLELYEPGRLVGDGERFLARAARGENEAGAVGAATQRAEDQPGPAVDTRVEDPSDRERGLDPGDSDELAGTATRNRTQAPPDLCGWAANRSRRGPRRARGRSGRRRSPPHRAPRRDRHRPGRQAPRPGAPPSVAHLGVGRPILDSERIRGRPGDFDGVVTSAALGQTCARATPNAGGSAVSRSVTVSGKSPVGRECVHGHLGAVEPAPRRGTAGA